MIFKDSKSSKLIHLSEIDILIMETTDITATTMLLKRLVDENILVIFCDDKRLPKAMLLPYAGRHDSSLQLAKQLSWDKERKAMVWTSIIRQKIENQSNVLNKIGATKRFETLRKFLGEVELLDATNREGHAARLYFQSLFGSKFSRRVDSDVNAALDYGYTLILSMFAREIAKSGCLTQLGLKHVNQYNEFNLASDIMEPFRPLVDCIVYEFADEPFPVIKRALFSLFSETFQYGKGEMYLNNIVSDYTKKFVKVMNGELDEVPVFSL